MKKFFDRIKSSGYVEEAIGGLLILVITVALLMSFVYHAPLVFVSALAVMLSVVLRDGSGVSIQNVRTVATLLIGMCAIDMIVVVAQLWVFELGLTLFQTLITLGILLSTLWYLYKEVAPRKSIQNWIKKNEVTRGTLSMIAVTLCLAVYTVVSLLTNMPANYTSACAMFLALSICMMTAGLLENELPFGAVREQRWVAVVLLLLLVFDFASLFTHFWIPLEYVVTVVQLFFAALFALYAVLYVFNDYVQYYWMYSLQQKVQKDLSSASYERRGNNLVIVFWMAVCVIVAVVMVANQNPLICPLGMVTVFTLCCFTLLGNMHTMFPTGTRTRIREIVILFFGIVFVTFVFSHTAEGVLGIVLRIGYLVVLGGEIVLTGVMVFLTERLSKLYKS